MEECSSCVKEPQGYIPIARIIDKLDSLYARDETDEAGRVLDYWEKEARTLGDEKGLLEILSEELGYFRSVLNAERGLKAAEECIALVEKNGTCNSVSTATLYLNAATTMRAFGQAEKALGYYETAKEIFEKNLKDDDPLLAGFYNNYAATLVSLKRFDEGEEFYLRAVETLKKGGGSPNIAVTYVNLAELQIERTKNEDDGEDYLMKSFDYLVNGGLERGREYLSAAKKCLPAFEYHGYFLQTAELKEIINYLKGRV